MHKRQKVKIAIHGMRPALTNARGSQIVLLLEPFRSKLIFVLIGP